MGSVSYTHLDVYKRQGQLHQRLGLGGDVDIQAAQFGIHGHGFRRMGSRVEADARQSGYRPLRQTGGGSPAKTAAQKKGAVVRRLSWKLEPDRSPTILMLSCRLWGGLPVVSSTPVRTSGRPAVASARCRELGGL